MKQTLPPLSPAERAHSERLIRRIRAELEANVNWMSFERYMEMALYEPGLGYYSAGTHKLGAGGDFVTAPEISALFGRCVADQCAQALSTLGGGSILELGAGSGAMAADILLELGTLGCRLDRYLILEISADLRARQQQTLAIRAPQLLARVEWLDRLPQAFEGVLLANEVLDALPVQRFHIHHGEVAALGVSWRDAQFGWSSAPAAPSLHNAIRGIEENLGFTLPDGYVSEINLRLRPWLAALAGAMQKGVMLWIDYGLTQREYYGRERSTGTLLCHYRQQFLDDPFVNVGLQDIGAWVDFTAVAEAAVDSRMEVLGFTTQAHFLIGAGIEHYLADGAAADEKARLRLAQQAQQLILPGEMGERFKVLALGKNFDAPLSGFGFRDMRERL